MYKIEDRAAYLKKLQQYLGIRQNGVFDKKTSEAVKNVQKAKGVTANGLVDYRTFVYILNNYKSKKSCSIIAPSVLPLRKGEQGRAILVLNSLLCELIEALNLDIVKPRGDFYNAYTEEAVAYFQTVFCYPSVPFVDEALYMRILSEIKSLKQ